MSRTALRYEIGYPVADPWLARNAMQWGVDKPTGTNVGILTAARAVPAVTVISGDTTLSSAGNQTFINYDFYGRVRVTSSGTKYFRNCRFFGNSALTSNTAAVDCTNSAVTDVVIEDSDLVPTAPSLWQNGILGHHYTLRRCKIIHGVDGAGVYNTSAPTGALGVLIEICYIAQHAWFKPDPNHSDGSHCDGVQIQGGSGLIVRGNYFSAYHDTSVGNSPWTRNAGDSLKRAMSCLMITPNVGAITNMTIAKNWMFGGEKMINGTAAGNSGNNLGSFTDNRFGRDAYSGHPFDLKLGCTYTASGNVYDDDNSAVPIRTI